jgi:hypothetical protein
MMRPKIISAASIISLFIGFSTPVFAQEPTANVAGRWEITVEAQPAAVLTLEQEGADLAGILSGDQGDLEVTGIVRAMKCHFRVLLMHRVSRLRSTSLQQLWRRTTH